MHEWKDGMMNPGQLTQIIRCSVAWGGCHTSRPSAHVQQQQHAAWETLAEGAGGFVSILDGRWVRAALEDRRSMATHRMMMMMIMIMRGGAVGSGGREEKDEVVRW